MSDYAKRQWLNPEGHSSTGAVVAFHGLSPWRGSAEERVQATFLEVSDCHDKVRLHRCEHDTMEEFIEKMEKLRDVVGEFAAHLRSTNHDNFVADLPRSQSV